MLIQAMHVQKPPTIFVGSWARKIRGKLGGEASESCPGGDDSSERALLHLEDMRSSGYGAGLGSLLRQLLAKTAYFK
jgi:hypothetical protein